jgi:Kdo2-lipid IVA lauroyltransferase/acyltransferase
MARSRSAVVDYLVYLAVRALVCVVQTLDWDSAYGLADFLAWLAYRLDKRHREVALDNLRHAFPEWTELRRDRTVRDMYRHFSAMVVEMIRGPRVLRKRNLDRYFDYENAEVKERFEAMHASGRPVLILTGHLGNWEIYGYAVGVFGIPVSAVARPLDNPYLDRFINRFRGATGQRMIAKQGEFDRINAVMTAKGTLALLVDQDAGQKGLYVEYFGRPASTYKSIALLALEYDALLLVGATLRMGRPLRYRVFADWIDPRDFAGDVDAVKRITQRYTAELEQLVRRSPEQYFWLHRRWKHQPIERKAKKSAAA